MALTCRCASGLSRTWQEKLARPVTFMDDCVGAEVEGVCASAADGKVILLENLRYHAAEEGSVKDEAGKKVRRSRHGPHAPAFCVGKG